MRAKEGQSRATDKPAQPITGSDSLNLTFPARLPPKGSKTHFCAFKVLGTRLVATTVKILLILRVLIMPAVLKPCVAPS